MDVEIRVKRAADSEGTLRSLYDWLVDEDDLRSSTVRLESASPLPDEMGAVTDLLTVALGAGGAGTALVSALVTWIRVRQPVAEIEIATRKGIAKLSLRNVTDTKDIVAQVSKVVDEVNE